MPEIAGDAALYVDPFKVEDIADKLIELFSNPALVRTIIERGNLQRQKFSWDKTAEKLWELIAQETKKFL
jgi:glycosyltransferase involved in cell wall biosynthesis